MVPWDSDIHHYYCAAGAGRPSLFGRGRGGATQPPPPTASPGSTPVTGIKLVITYPSIPRNGNPACAVCCTATANFRTDARLPVSILGCFAAGCSSTPLLVSCRPPAPPPREGAPGPGQYPSTASFLGYSAGTAPPQTDFRLVRSKFNCSVIGRR